jgi:hypothetical protein
MKKTLAIVIIILILKIPFSFFALPYVKGGYRTSGDLQKVASDIIQIADGNPIYCTNVTSAGMGVCANLDMKLPENQFVKRKPETDYGVILTYNTSDRYGKLIKEYAFRGNHMYLYSLDH